MTEDDLAVQLRNFISEQKQSASELSKQAEAFRKFSRAADDAANAASDLLSIVGYPEIVREQLDHIRNRLSKNGIEGVVVALKEWFNKHTFHVPDRPTTPPLSSEVLLWLK